MNSSKTSGFGLILDNRDFIIPFILLTAFISILLGFMGNDGLFLYLNRHNSAFADFLLLHITHLGDGIIAAVLVIVLLWISFRESLTFLAITLLLAIAVTVLKNYVFPDLDRPVEYFKTSETLRLVAGYDPPGLCTFPSGHTATIFSICLYLSFLSKNRLTKFILFCIAALVSYSRIYLSAHFPADILAGAAIAVPVTIICYSLSRRIQNPSIDRKIVIRDKVPSIEEVS